jgi:hypothetical protein
LSEGCRCSEETKKFAYLWITSRRTRPPLGRMPSSLVCSWRALNDIPITRWCLAGFGWPRSGNVPSPTPPPSFGVRIVITKTVCARIRQGSGFSSRNISVSIWRNVPGGS